ncbi:hypothetical protein FISHEDRAFT_70294 [Fistulina hepatica ATCC 64428]|uniref:Hemerythrin-like domain-containing protein n=1 Tax=Fistulina hepatica ATCC 64428 TaxID=1128425 RepID=A0A0D7AJW9_9AGAR|nr:hypothetical protein FISHEDRAFT_70294 [Fistulina hepatica ATCC 64428]
MSYSPPYPLCQAPDIGNVKSGNDIEHTKRLGWDMANAHNVLFHGLNAMYNNAPNLRTRKDEVHFANYCLCFAGFLHEHHDIEEKLVFPILREHGLDMTKNSAEHEAFLPTFGEFETYVTTVRDGKEEYDADKLRALLRAFADTLVAHLHDEMSTITPEQMSKLDKPTVAAMMDAVMKGAMSSPPLTVGAFAFLHTDPKASPPWPCAPAPAVWIMKNIFLRWHKNDYWRFAPFDINGQPRT